MRVLGIFTSRCVVSFIQVPHAVAPKTCLPEDNLTSGSRCRRSPHTRIDDVGQLRRARLRDQRTKAPKLGRSCLSSVLAAGQSYPSGIVHFVTGRGRPQVDARSLVSICCNSHYLLRTESVRDKRETARSVLFRTECRPLAGYRPRTQPLPLARRSPPAFKFPYGVDQALVAAQQ